MWRGEVEEREERRGVSDVMLIVWVWVRVGEERGGESPRGVWWEGMLNVLEEEVVVGGVGSPRGEARDRTMLRRGSVAVAVERRDEVRSEASESKPRLRRALA